jgi:ribokinase
MILVAGSANLDFVVQVPTIPAPGETVLGHDLAFFSGGKGANQATACARAGGVATEMLLALGDDWLAETIESSLRAANVKMHLIRTQNLRTGAAFVSVNGDAENAITVAPGANDALSVDDLPPLDGCSHLLLQLETPVSVVAAYARVAREKGVTVVLNAAPAQRLSAEILALLDILVVNEGEAKLVAGHDGTIASCVSRLGVPCTVVTLGHRGCCAVDGAATLFQPGFAVNAMDTTAAGDTFCGVLVAALSRGRSLQTALLRANAAAALACSKRGAQDSIPCRDDIDYFLKNELPPAGADSQALKEHCGFDGEDWPDEE